MAGKGWREVIKLVGEKGVVFCFIGYGAFGQWYTDTSKMAKDLEPKDETERRGMGRQVVIFTSGRPDGSLGMLRPVDLCRCVLYDRYKSRLTRIVGLVFALAKRGAVRSNGRWETGRVPSMEGFLDRVWRGHARHTLPFLSRSRRGCIVSFSRVPSSERNGVGVCMRPGSPSAGKGWECDMRGSTSMLAVDSASTGTSGGCWPNSAFSLTSRGFFLTVLDVVLGSSQSIPCQLDPLVASRHPKICSRVKGEVMPLARRAASCYFRPPLQ